MPSAYLADYLQWQFHSGERVVAPGPFVYGHSLSSFYQRRAVVSFWQKNVHNTG